MVEEEQEEGGGGAYFPLPGKIGLKWIIRKMDLKEEKWATKFVEKWPELETEKLWKVWQKVMSRYGREKVPGSTEKSFPSDEDVKIRTNL